ncbi:MAG: Hint domain-containing protein, partial [Roseomonas sp.]|nr:Hint domain-containing protein [Roseomonas sp.]
GGAGNDTLLGGVGWDSLAGGEGTDLLSFARLTGAVTVDLAAGTANVRRDIDLLPGEASAVYDGRLNVFSTQRGTWTDAQNFFLNRGGNLVTINDQAENNQLFALAAANSTLGPPWLGGTDAEQEGVWRWTNGEAFNFTNWYEAWPNDAVGGEDYLGFFGWPGYVVAEWNDWGGFQSFPAIGEFIIGSTSTLSGIENAFGSAGNDFLLGNDLANLLGGGAGNDSLSGGNGADTLNGGAGNDTLVGGNGADIASYADATGAVTVDLAAGTSSGADGADSLTGFEGALGGGGADSLLGGAADETLIGGLGSDSLSGSGGNDWASYASATGAVTVDLGAGSSNGADGSDSLTGIEAVLGGNGDDSLLGGNGTDTLNGGNGNDDLAGGNGNDSLFGDVGNDTLNGGLGTDTLNGGDGSADFASYADASGTIGASLSDNAIIGGVAEGGGGSDRLFGIEGLIGSNFNDTLVGNSAVNTLMGGDGSDSLVGGGGNDLLNFGAGNDEFQWVSGVTTGDLTLIGGDGNDFLNLGAGWVSGPVTTNDWINFQRTDGNDTIYTQGWETIVCFAEGTRIVTLNGEDAVENLRAGDMVLAMRDGQAGFEPLRWVGFMDIAVPRHSAMAAKTAPILIKADAIAPGMPARDLRVSPDHAMEVDGHLIPAKHLVNGVSIIQESWCRRVRYFHLELEAHGLLLSEGTWSESYLDDGNRHAFNNAAMTGLFLDFEAGRSKGQYDDQVCLPVLRQGLRLDEIHGRIALRAEELVRGTKGRRGG